MILTTNLGVLCACLTPSTLASIIAELEACPLAQAQRDPRTGLFLGTKEKNEIVEMVERATHSAKMALIANVGEEDAEKLIDLARI